MLSDEARQAVQQRFTRRFVWGTSTIFSVSLALLLLLLGFTHPNNWVVLNGETTFAGFFNPYLLIGGAGLLTAVGIHTLWLLWREERLRSRRFAVAVHGALTLFSGLMLLFLVASSWMIEGLKQAYGSATMPQLPVAPPPVIWLLPLIVLITFLPHGLRWLYQELLERTLNKAESRYEKPKRSIAELVDDDTDDLLYTEELTGNLKAQKE